MASTAALTSAPSVEAELPRLRGLQKGGRHGEALSAAQSLLADWPENRDLLLIGAISLRHLLRLPEALAALDRLEALQPHFSRLHQERGLCRVALKDAPGAIQALLLAVNLNPALPGAWSMLEGLYRLTGDPQNAATAAEHVATLKRLPPEVVTATALFHDGDLGPAEQIVRAYLLQHGDHPEAMRLLARIGMARDVLDDAEVLLEAVLALAPDYQAARHDYAQTLVQRHKYVEARAQITRLLQLDPANLDYRSLAATTAVGTGRAGHGDCPLRGDARRPAERPGRPPVARTRAEDGGPHVGGRGRLSRGGGGAVGLRRRLLEPRQPEVLPVQRRGDRADAEPRRPRPPLRPCLTDRHHLCFALGKALEDRGETAESWRYYAQGNALKRSESRYRPDDHRDQHKKADRGLHA